MKRPIAMTAIMLLLAAPAGACGFSGKWISDARGMTEFVIFDGPVWELYVEYHFVDGGMIQARTSDALSLRSSDGGAVSEWRYRLIDEDAMMLSGPEGEMRLFYRLENCAHTARKAMPAAG